MSCWYTINLRIFFFLKKCKLWYFSYLKYKVFFIYFLHCFPNCWQNIYSIKSQRKYCFSIFFFLILITHIVNKDLCSVSFFSPNKSPVWVNVFLILVYHLDIMWTLAGKRKWMMVKKKQLLLPKVLP